MKYDKRYKTMFTVFTATYNRAHTLERVYKSLRSQTYKDFEWVIVDDGSEDETEEIVQAWTKEANFPIRYYWQKNQHKKVAHNFGVSVAKGMLFVNLDSDDECVPNSLEIFKTYWDQIPAHEIESYSGLCALCLRPDGEVVGTRFPLARDKTFIDTNAHELRHRYKVTGEKWGCTRTEVLRQFPFPEQIEGYVPENVVWSLVEQRYKRRFFNRGLRIYHSGDDQITGSSTFCRSGQGHALLAQRALTLELGWFIWRPMWFMKMAANYTRFQAHMNRNGHRLDLHLNSIGAWSLVLLTWPAGIMRYWMDIWKTCP